MLIKDLLNYLSKTYSATFRFEDLETSVDLIFTAIYGEKRVNIPISLDNVLTSRKIFPKIMFLGEYKRWYSPEKVLVKILDDRLNQILSRDVPFISILKDDISRFLDIGTDITSVSSENALIKFKNRVKFLRQSNPETKEPFICLGDSLRREWQKLKPNEIKEVLKTIPVLASSEAHPSEGYFTYFLKENYKAIGYKFEEGNIKTIFNTESKLSQIISRHKSCVCNDHIEFSEVSTPVISYQDNPEKTKAITNAVIVFDEITKEGDLLGGEILTSRNFAQKNVNPIRTQDIELKPGTRLNVNVSEVIFGGKKDQIGTNKDGEPIYIPRGLKRATCLEIREDKNFDNRFHITWKGVAEIGCARVVSDSGIKGMTKPVNDLGYISYNGQDFDVDMKMGPNSIKAGYNTIVLAKLGLYGKVNNKILNINSMTQDEINSIHCQIQPVKWSYVEDGHLKSKKVWAGILPIQVTELASEYCKVKTDHKMLPEIIKYFNHYGYNDIVEHFLKFEDNKSKKKATEECIKILLKKSESCKTLNYDELLSWMAGTDFPIISFGDKCKLEGLLNPLNDGFCYQYEDKLIRFPSNWLINELSDEIKTGEVRYTTMFNRANRLLLSLRGKKIGKSYHQNKKQIENAIKAYEESINNELAGKGKLINDNCVTKVFGIAAKQVTDYRVPDNIVVIMDPFYNTLITEAGINYHCGARDPIIWSFQVGIKKVWTREDFEVHLKLLGEKIENVLLPEYGKDVILKSPKLAMLEQSDCDGDIDRILSPVGIEVQNLLEKHYYEDYKTLMKDYEVEWMNNYERGEASNSKLEPQPFKWYEVNYEKYREVFADSAIAKAQMGVATLQHWEFYAACEIAEKKNLINSELKHKLVFTYARLVQDCVIRGIKHNEGGSSGFTPFFLNNIIKKQYFEVITKTLQSFGLNKSEILFFFKIAKLHSTKKNLISSAVGLQNGYKFNLNMLMNPEFDLLFQAKTLSFLKEMVVEINKK